MSAYFVLVLAVLSRLLPHAIHAAGINLTATGGSLLYFGARRSRWQALFAVLAFAATDYYLTVYAYHAPFYVNSYVATWVWYAAVCLFAHRLLSTRATFLRVGGAVLASATSFFLLSNFVVWFGSGMYPHSLAGIGLCYIAAIPFYANDIVSTAITAGALFGLPVLATRIAESFRTPARENLS
jgi:hypothetical protein